MISIIDYGMGNLKSVYKAFKHIGSNVEITSNPAEILKADAVVLPGVGAFGDAMENLKNLELIDVIKEVIDNKKPFLGICLGLQLLFKSSEEFGNTEGIGIFNEKLRLFPKIPELKVPHMGWNSIDIIKKSPLFNGIENLPYVYFVHSYYLDGSFEYVSSVADYGVSVGASVWKDNVCATQFHPEKSGDVGIKMLENFVRLV